jgi:RNA polymerase sigma-70 factor (ECF subfamily)
MLLVLETLSPMERAVFVLSEAFGYSHAEVLAHNDPVH